MAIFAARPVPTPPPKPIANLSLIRAAIHTLSTAFCRSIPDACRRASSCLSPFGDTK